MSPPGNTPLPPLPGAGGVVHGAAAQANPWAAGANPAVVAVAPQERNDPFPGLPAPKSTRTDRAPLWLLIASAIIVVAMIAGGAYVVLKGGRQYPSAWDTRVGPIANWVSDERDLEFTHAVEVNFLTEEQYTARSTEGGDDASEETARYYEDQAAQMRALGFLSGDVDLAAANDTLSDSGTLAYYDTELEQIFVRGTELTPDLKVTLAHELTHVLQDQNFDLERLQDIEGGRGAVLRSLAEGDARAVESAYIEDELSEEEVAAYQEAMTASSDEANEELDAKVPPILSTLFGAPYILGPELIAVLDLEGGHKAINEALQNPPTEEVLFDPLVNDDPAADGKPVTVTAPEGVEIIEQDEFGPTTLYLMLASRMDPRIALTATDGWGGDQYVTYLQDEKICIDVNLEGDTPEDTAQIGDALGSWAALSPEGTAEVSTADGVVAFHTCDPGKEAEAAGGEVTSDLLDLPVTRTQIYTDTVDTGDGNGLTPDQARCYANGIVDRLTFSQLHDSAYLESDAASQLYNEIAMGCAQ